MVSATSAPVAGHRGGVLVRPAFHGVVDGAGHGQQQRVGRGGQPGRGREQVMTPGQVGLLVGDHRRPAAVVQAVQQAGRRPRSRPGPPGSAYASRAGPGMTTMPSSGLQPGSAPVGLGQGPRPAAEQTATARPQPPARASAAAVPAAGGDRVAAPDGRLRVIARPRPRGGTGPRRRRPAGPARPCCSRQGHGGHGQQPGGLARLQPGRQRPGGRRGQRRASAAAGTARHMRLTPRRRGPAPGARSPASSWRSSRASRPDSPDTNLLSTAPWSVPAVQGLAHLAGGQAGLVDAAGRRSRGRPARGPAGPWRAAGT